MVDWAEKLRSRLRQRPPGQISDLRVSRSMRKVADQALSRTSGAPLIPGNSLRILKDADGNYPVWLEAIRSAKRLIYLENYIFDEDETGIEFAKALAERARAGVKVRLIRDWMGSRAGASRSFWRSLKNAGVDVRAFNPPRLDSPFGWLSRDHRKMLAVDSEVAFVTGLCISQRWKGNPARGIPPWRDTGVEIHGPAVAAVEEAFAEIWEAASGGHIPEDERSRPADLPEAGEVALRIVAGAPNTAGLFRMDQLIAAQARRSLWLTDAYFVGVTPYVQALRAAARDGVDVRLLLPNATDLPLIRPLSRAGYRPLIEAGVRIFEWNGPMIHAKTAVADGRWSRVGSSNLNIASFLGNYELDVAIDDEGVAQAMEEMYAHDLEHATEIVLSRNRVRRLSTAVPIHHRSRADRRAVRQAGRKGSVAAAGAIRIANAVGAAVTNHRVLGPAESRVLFLAGLGLVAIALLGVLWPWGLAVPLAALSFWVGGALVWRAARLRRKGPAEDKVVTEPEALSEIEALGVEEAELVRAEEARESAREDEPPAVGRG
jgi:cardiolipin synthase